MRWRTHTAIARAIADALGLNKKARSALVAGSIDPDKRPDLAVRFSRRGVYIAGASHHNPSLRLVMKHVWRARRSYLRGDEVEALRSLGRALHYIQDVSVSRSTLGLSHKFKETKVALLDVPVMAVRDGLSSAICSPHYVEETIKKVKPQRDARGSLEEACRVSGSIAGAVLGRREPPEGLMEDFAQAQRRYWRRTMPLAAAASLIFLISTLATRNIILALGVLSGYVIQLLDREYHYLRKEAEWYEVKNLKSDKKIVATKK